MIFVPGTCYLRWHLLSIDRRRVCDFMAFVALFDNVAVFIDVDFTCPDRDNAFIMLSGAIMVTFSILCRVPNKTQISARRPPRTVVLLYI